ncbi:hypothetical protein QBC35DRAFT_79264 [Podospora australis]|uniref:Transmembrane protein n=1 Tax=Podospora australis TaxID=1536484 RepID=A0AAN7AKB4_9PEZI|nr:hypothetical protein QBC35DRAFT_79264 [Podospora australis]
MTDLMARRQTGVRQDFSPLLCGPLQYARGQALFTPLKAVANGRERVPSPLRRFSVPFPPISINALLLVLSLLFYLLFDSQADPWKRRPISLSSPSADSSRTIPGSYLSVSKRKEREHHRPPRRKKRARGFRFGSVRGDRPPLGEQSSERRGDCGGRAEKVLETTRNHRTTRNYRQILFHSRSSPPFSYRLQNLGELQLSPPQPLFFLTRRPSNLSTS